MLINELKRFSVSAACLLGFALVAASASLLSGCGDTGQMKMSEQTDDPATIAKGSMDFYKNAHLKSGTPKKK
jgi:hypothetical protein